MKIKLILVPAVLAFICAAFLTASYIHSLSARAASLEARLARLETEVAGVRNTVTVAPAPPPPQQIVLTTNSLAAFDAETSLEGRVQQLEQELRPHPEFLPLARP
jgi:hypothetical protein